MLLQSAQQQTQNQQHSPQTIQLCDNLEQKIVTTEQQQQQQQHHQQQQSSRENYGMSTFTPFTIPTTTSTISSMAQIPTIVTSSPTASPTEPPPPGPEPIVKVSKFLDVIQDTLKDGWTVHTTKEGRLYYCNHITRTSQWLPPAECWGLIESLPYGWEKAFDTKKRPYYINHLNKSTTYEAPEIARYDEAPPEPRLVVLQRSQTKGFGFVAGSEKPVIVRFVTEGSPSVNKLEPGDQILSINGEDVKEAPRDHVIQLVRSCESEVSLLVCQPSNVGCSGKKSTLLSAGKRAKLKSRPNRVRFAESVCVNGAPLFPPSAFSLGDLCVPPMANVLKVFLENGQTKSFKYDATTTVQDVVTSLRDKLCLSAVEHFSLVLEHVKSLKRNKLTLLDPMETLSRIAARPGAHKLRCLFRVSFVPVSAAILAQKDLNALDYLYMQCCNDVTQERFAPELQADVALRLAALHMHQHALANNISPTKLTVKTVEREFGLERFVPSSLVDGMKRKELRRLLGHFLKQNTLMTGSANKMLTQLQAKIHYLDIISGLPSYGAKCFSTNQRDGIDRVLLISPRFGLSQIIGVRNSVPQPICAIEEIRQVSIQRENDVTNSATVFFHPDRFITFLMEDRDACEFSLVLAGYHLLLAGNELPVEREREEFDDEEMAPPYLSQHSVIPSSWSYISPALNRTHSMAFMLPPPYHAIQQLTMYKEDGDENHCDKNMNTTLMNKNHNGDIDEFGFDVHSVVTMEILEGTKNSKYFNNHQHSRLNDTRNEEVLKRVAEMQKMIENSERYLNEHGDLIVPGSNELKINVRTSGWKDQSLELDSDCESLNSSKVSSNEENPAPGALKHSDSLVLLAETIALEFNGLSNDGITNKSPNGINNMENKLLTNQTTPTFQRRAKGLSQLISDLKILGTDLSQSESDSESTYTPQSSPIHRTNQLNGTKPTTIRTSFGLHSPDTVFAPESKDTNLKDYLRHLKEASNNESLQDTDLAAKKLSELYGFEIGDDTFIETDPDVIDLTTIPPPQTPDELDALDVLDAAPRGFGDAGQQQKVSSEDGELEKFLAKVVVVPPTQKITPAKELTPEEIMSFIIPPPPNLSDDALKKAQMSNGGCDEPPINIVARPIFYPKKPESLYSNSNSMGTMKMNGHVNPVIEYSTIDRKGPFSCCSKTKKDDEPTASSPDATGGAKLKENTPNLPLSLPPRKCIHSASQSPPERPPKSLEIQKKLNSPTTSPVKTTMANNSFGDFGNYYEMNLPPVPQRILNNSIYSTTARTIKPKPIVSINPLSTLPKKPPLPPLPNKSMFRSPHPLPKTITTTSTNNGGVQVRVTSIGSPLMNRQGVSGVVNHFNGITASSQQQQLQSIGVRMNGHYRSFSDSNGTQQQQPGTVQCNGLPPQLSMLCSPQMSRRVPNLKPHNHVYGIPSQMHAINLNQSPLLTAKNGHVINVESLLQKTDVAMAGLLVRLDQIAAQCSAAQTAGGGTQIDENKFQRARDELTDQALLLVTASKQLVITLSDSISNNIPEHLTVCLTSLRRITELAQDMTRHTSSPLQTRNIVLKVHDVASSFRELVSVPVGPLGAGKLALQAEYLANMLATLLRSLRVFSP